MYIGWLGWFFHMLPVTLGSRERMEVDLRAVTDESHAEADYLKCKNWLQGTCCQILLLGRANIVIYSCILLIA